MIRQKLRGILIERQEREYRRKLRGKHIYYNDWITDLEEMAPDKDTGGLSAALVKYGDIDRLIYSCKDKSKVRASDQGFLSADIVIFTADSGKMARYAQVQICAFFAADRTLALVYGDEDSLLGNGEYGEPYFKPDWSPDSFDNAFYIGSIYAVRTSLLKKFMNSADKPCSGNADSLFRSLADMEHGFDKRIGLRFPVGHISEILFHRDCKLDLFMGRGFDNTVNISNSNIGSDNNGNDSDKDKAVSIVIPSRDHPDILFRCIDSILGQSADECREPEHNITGHSADECRESEHNITGHSADECREPEHNITGQSADDDASHNSVQGLIYEIIIVDNGSNAVNKALIEQRVKALTAGVKSHGSALTNIRYIYTEMEFNFSKMCNIGAEASAYEYILFLNDDIEIVSDGWLEMMRGLAAKPRAGAVGMKLLYPETDLIQHAGITKVRLGPMHKLQKLHDGEVHYYGFNRGIHDLIGVTGACLMVSRSKFEEAGRFSTELAVAFNDVDLCYSILEKGYYNICCNNMFLYHHESLSRGNDNIDTAKLARLGKEYEILTLRHADLCAIDPFYNKYLSDDEHVADFIRNQEMDKPMQKLADSGYRIRRSFNEKLTDECLRIGVEYADTAEKWIRNYKIEEDGIIDGYFIKGYSFVIGSDNALYDRKLILRRTTGKAGETVPSSDDIYVMNVDDCYREDIRNNLKGQVNVELTGFRVRIGKNELTKGRYQIGIVVSDRTSRQKIVNWAPNLLITDGSGDVPDENLAGEKCK